MMEDIRIRIAGPGSALQTLWEQAEPFRLARAGERAFTPNTPEDDQLVLAALKQCRSTRGHKLTFCGGVPFGARTYVAPSGAELLVYFYPPGGNIRGLKVRAVFVTPPSQGGATEEEGESE